MGKNGIVRGFAVTVKILGDHSGDGHGHSDKTVVIYADPDDVEPRQAALRGPPGAAVAAAAFGKPVDGPHPGYHGLHVAEVILLVVQVGGDIMAHKGKEGGNGKCFIAVADDLIIDGMPVLPEAQPGRDGVDGDHEQDANDVLLLAGLGVVEGMLPYQEEARDDGYDGAGASDKGGQPVESEAGDEVYFRSDCTGETPIRWSASIMFVRFHFLPITSDGLSWRSGGACRTRRDDRGLFGAKMFLEARRLIAGKPRTYLASPPAWYYMLNSSWALVVSCGRHSAACSLRALPQVNHSKPVASTIPYPFPVLSCRGRRSLRARH